jgi:tetratricopeptide (TPR) repeat protein
MSLGSVPGDLARWKTFTSTFEALNRDVHALRFLRPFVSIEPTGALRGMLAELLAKPGNDPAGALTLVAQAPAIQANRQGVVTLEHVAASRALALLGKSDDAVKILERALTDDAGNPVNLDNRTAWLALAFAYATRLEVGDAFKGANILLRVSYAVGPESGARFQSMASLLRGLGRNMGPQHLMAALKEEEAAASRAASNPAASNPAESRPASSSPSQGDNGVR